MRKIPLESYSESGYKNFQEYFQTIIDEYFIEQESLNILNQKEKEILKNTSELLKLIIKKYLNGFSGEAYKDFLEMMEPLKKRFFNLSETTYNTEYVKKLKEDIDKININKASINEIKRLINEEANVLIDDNSLDKLYRLRVKKETEDDFKKMDLFHIPFDRYTKIRSYRYSIAGYPCLYLGTSFKNCYEELRKPKKEKVWMMEYKLKEKIMYINLTKRTEKTYIIFKEIINFLKEIKEEERKNFKVIFGGLNREIRRKIETRKNQKFKDFNKKKNLILNNQISSQEKIKILNEILRFFTPKKYLSIKKDLKKMANIINLLEKLAKNKKNELKNLFLIYPLQMATAIKTNDDDDKFSPEYIIPQLLMQWVRKNSEFYGIKYISTRIDEDKSYKEFCNFAFPARNSKNKYCEELLRIFEINEPVRAIDEIEFE